jgi:type III secretion protein R
MRWLLPLLILLFGVDLIAQGVSSPQLAAAIAPGGMTPGLPSQLGILPTVSVLLLLSLLPFAVMLLTSFTKIAVVLSLLRQALGTQSAPPTQVITGLATLLTIYVMFPTGLAMYKAAEERINQDPPNALFSDQSALYIYDIAAKAREPLRLFLKNNTQGKTIEAYYQTAQKVLPEEHKADIQREDFLVLMPAYITGQLKSAFEVGVLIYLPFFVIDLVVSNILLAMGMMMLSPLTIALPLKLLLLVMVDGWTLLLQGLVTSYHQPGA